MNDRVRSVIERETLHALITYRVNVAGFARRLIAVWMRVSEEAVRFGQLMIVPTGSSPHKMIARTEVSDRVVVDPPY
jgi:hypothetical protein